MKKNVLIAFALVALAFASCKKDMVIVPEPTTDIRLHGDWIYAQIEHPTGHVQITIEPWTFTEDSLITKNVTLDYIANGRRLIVAKLDTFSYSFNERGYLVMVDENGNTLICRR